MPQLLPQSKRKSQGTGSQEADAEVERRSRSSVAAETTRERSVPCDDERGRTDRRRPQTNAACGADRRAFLLGPPNHSQGCEVNGPNIRETNEYYIINRFDTWWSAWFNLAHRNKRKEKPQ